MSDVNAVDKGLRQEFGVNTLDKGVRVRRAGFLLGNMTDTITIWYRRQEKNEKMEKNAGARVPK